MSRFRRTRVVVAGFFSLMVALALTSLSPTYTKDRDKKHDFEVWAVDQAVGAGTLYIYDGKGMDVRAASAVPEVHDLSADVTPLCLAKTGTAPVRGHMLGLNSTHSHAILAYVTTGH